MEVSSSEVARFSSSSSKRKAEFDPKDEEEEEGEESGDESGDESESKIKEPEVEIDMLEAPEWDVDSFEGLEYYSSSELESSSDDDKVAMEHYRINKRQIIESKGFYMDPKLRPSLYYKRIQPRRLELEM